MIDGLGEVNQSNRMVVTPRPAERARVTAQSQGAPTPVPAAPPAEVLEMLDTAATVMRELASSQVRMHIEVVDGGAGKRIHIQVVDAEGTLLREIPPHQMFDVLAGTSRGLAFDEQG